jgi:DNA-directed RNA polymerase subunit E'/Rpb7
MEQTAIFEEKVYLTPRDVRKLKTIPIHDLLLEHLKQKLEKRCSSHGWVIPNTLSILSRSMGQFDHGQFTGNITYHVQAEGRVYNPANGTRIVGKIVKKNKMGLYVLYEDAIRILVPRDLHIGREDFEELDIDDVVELELRKSRFQIQDLFILSVGVFLRRTEEGARPLPESAESLDSENETENENANKNENENQQSQGTNGNATANNAFLTDDESEAATNEDTEEEEEETPPTPPPPPPKPASTQRKRVLVRP